MAGQYAASTDVPPERSQSEISETVRRYGATSFVYAWQEGQALVEFTAQARRVRFLVPMPDPEDREFRLTPTRGVERTEKQRAAAYEQAVRQRWRALLLAIKAKLEAVQTGITSFESEFMAHIVLPDGATVAQHVLPSVRVAYESGRMPAQILPAFGDAPREIES